MAFRAVLDACVLFPFSLRDTLLRLAEVSFDEESVVLYSPLWSERILAELRENLIGHHGITPEKADYLTECMREAFPEAVVPQSAVDALEPVMTNEPADRHILATAVAGNAEIIVTVNLKHFKREHSCMFGVKAVHPDEFLCDLLDLSPGAVVVAVRQQASDLRNPPMTFQELISGHLAAAAPTFAASLAEVYGDGRRPPPAGHGS